MGLKIGKFLGRLAGGAIKAAPQIIGGFSAGGLGGGSLAALGSLKLGGGSAAPAGSAAMYGGAPTSFLPGQYNLPAQQTMTAQTVAQRGGGVPAVQVTQEVYNALLKIADRLGIRIMNPNAVVRIGRNLVAKLIRFSRATPGLTIVSMLLNLGLTVIEANNVVTWFSTAGKRRRRIRVTNVKALNRSVRRLEGFTRLARRVEASLARRSSVRSARRTRRCFKCRKSPCSC